MSNYDKIPVFHYFENVNKGHLNMSMSTMKNSQILLYCYFNNIIEGSGTSFLSPALNQKYIRNVYHTAH